MTAMWIANWLRSIEQQDKERMARGKTYARQGKVKSLKLEPPYVRAEVKGSRHFPYDVELVFAPMATEARLLLWRLFEQTLPGQEGIPEHWLEAFDQAGLRLIPDPQIDCSMDCNCPDWSWPCKHIAAVCVTLAALFAEDPWLILRLQGFMPPDLRQAAMSDPALSMSWQDYWGLSLDLPPAPALNIGPPAILNLLGPVKGLTRKQMEQALLPVYQQTWQTAAELIQALSPDSAKGHKDADKSSKM